MLAHLPTEAAMPSSGDAFHHSHASLDSGQAILSMGSILRMDKVHIEK